MRNAAAGRMIGNTQKAVNVRIAGTVCGIGQGLNTGATFSFLLVATLKLSYSEL